MYPDGAAEPGRVCLAIRGDRVLVSSALPCDWFLVRAVPGAYDDSGAEWTAGSDTLQYAVTMLAAGGSSFSFEAGGKSSGLPAVGTFYIAAAFSGAGMPDTIACRDPLQDVSPSVVQVAVRPGDGYLDYLYEAMGTPFIMGPRSTPSGGHQADDRLGFDCAGLAVYGARRMGLEIPYLGPVGILPYLDPVSEGLLSPVEADGEVLYRSASGDPAEIGTGGIRPGDLLHFRCQVSVFLEDAGVPGVLDPQDIVIQSWFDGPMVCTLEENGFYGLPLRVFRWGRTTSSSTPAEQ